MRTRAALIAAAVISATAITISIVSVASAGRNVTKIHVVEHADSDTVVETGGTTGDDTTGDLLTFANDVYDATDQNIVGSDQGDCIRIEPGATWECRWVTTFDDGSITVEGPFSDTGSTVLAITGGTGVYKNARGQMKLEYHNDAGTAFDFLFKVITD